MLIIRGVRLRYGDLFQDWEIAVAKKLISEFRGKWKCLKHKDFDDLLQECLTHWYYKKNHYRSGKKASFQTYMGRVVRNKLTDLVREREADKRKTAYLAMSLDEPVKSEGSRTLLEEIDQGAITGYNPDPFLEIELRVDVMKALKKLTCKQQELCLLLGESGLNVKEASQILGTPRSTINDELKRIRTIFLKEGLADYLE